MAIFFEIADFFCEAYNNEDGYDVEIDPSLLYLVVVATYDDISRYKAYHLSDPTVQRSNALKRAAYAAKWIMHFSPLVHPAAGHLSGQIGQHDGLANAVFAIHFIMTNIEEFTGTRCYLTSDVYYGMLYDLIYRNIGGEPLILVLELICKAIRSEAIVG